MKFRGKMIESLSMKQFSGTITTLSKLGKHCVIRLTPDNVFFIISDDGVLRKPLAWCVLEQAHFFNEYNVIGVSEQNNQICLEFVPDMLARALASLKSAHTPKSVKLKLTKKRTPCLTCEIELPSVSQHSRICTHDIPVQVIARREWSEFSEPTIPQFDVSFHMPNLRKLKNICERMKALSSHMVVSANHDGAMTLKAETDLVTVVTHFKELIVEDRGDVDDRETYRKTRVDSKKLINFLSIENVNPSKVVCNIVEKKMLHMHVFHEDVTLHYFIPAVSM